MMHTCPSLLAGHQGSHSLQAHFLCPCQLIARLSIFTRQGRVLEGQQMHSCSIVLRLHASAGVGQESDPCCMDAAWHCSMHMVNISMQELFQICTWDSTLPASCHRSRLLASDPTTLGGCLCHQCRSCNRAAQTMCMHRVNVVIPVPKFFAGRLAFYVQSTVQAEQSRAFGDDTQQVGLGLKQPTAETAETAETVIDR